MDPAFAFHAWRRSVSNWSLIEHRDFQGFLVTGQQSGTQWIKWMLSLAIAAAYGVAAPRYYNNPSSNDLVGHPRHARKHPGLPRIASSHAIPGYPVGWRAVRALLALPPYVVVVRDIRDVLVSHYAKWRHRYWGEWGVSFSDYVRGAPRGNRFICDVWWYIHFKNRWGVVAERFPDETLVLRYEEIRKAPGAALARIARHFDLALDAAAIAAAVEGGTKAAMRRHHDPSVALRVVRDDDVDGPTYADDDRAVLGRILKDNLKYDFGYDYAAWAPPDRGRATRPRAPAPRPDRSEREAK